MDTRQILDHLFAAGRDMAERGTQYARQAQDYAADRLGVGDDETSRETFGKGAVGGALAAGALTLLLGTRAGRALGGAALRVGALAGLGTLAYNAYKKYTGSDQPQEEATSVGALEDAAAETRSRAILAAMISAAKADGHIDDQEREVIETRMKGLDGVDTGFIETALKAPVDPSSIAKLADTPQAAREIYAVSVYMTDANTPEERRYLDDLATNLGLEAGIARAIEDEVHGA